MASLRAMLPILLLNLLGLATVHSASVGLPGLSQTPALGNRSPVIGPDAPGTQPLPTTNISLLGDIIDERFTINVRVATEKVSGEQCLMNLLKTLVQLSFEDFEQVYSVGTYTYPDYPDVTMSITEASPKIVPLTHRFVIWGICNTVRSMFNTSGIRGMIIILFWNESGKSGAQVAVGNILIKPTHEPGIGASNHTRNLTGLARRSETLPPGLGFSNLIGIGEAGTNTAPANVDPLVVFAELYGSVLPLQDVFICIFVALTYMASHPTTGTMGEWGIKDLDTEVRFDWVIDHSRTEPPFFEWGYAIRALASIPELMFRKKRFGEVKVLVGYGKVSLGVGYVHKGNNPPKPPGNFGTA